MYDVYVIYNAEATKYYIGQTENIVARLAQHNDHTYKSYTSRFPGEWKLIYKESVATRSEALKREKSLKTGNGRAYIRSIIPHKSFRPTTQRE
jgi:putative endonuclease